MFFYQTSYFVYIIFYIYCIVFQCIISIVSLYKTHFYVCKDI